MLLQIVLIGLYAQWSSFSEGIWAGAYVSHISLYNNREYLKNNIYTVIVNN